MGGGAVLGGGEILVNGSDLGGGYILGGVDVLGSEDFLGAEMIGWQRRLGRRSPFGCRRHFWWQSLMGIVAKISKVAETFLTVAVAVEIILMDRDHQSRVEVISKGQSF